MLAKFDAPARGGVSNAHAPDSDNSVVRDAKVMDCRGFKALYMDMDSSAFFPGYFPINIVYVAIIDVYMFVCSLRSFCKHVYAKQIPLVIVCSVGIRDFQAVDFPVRWILQKQAGDVLPMTVDSGPFPIPIDINSDGSLFCAIAGRGEHPVELHCPLEQDDISWEKNSCTKSVELLLGVNVVFLGRAWEALHGK
jgi:hypothetical protein